MTRSVVFCDLSEQYQRYQESINSRIQKVLNHGQYILGPEVAELEDKLASFVGVTHAIGVASGTDALLMCLMALDVGPGDEIITTPFSFIATAEVICLLGAKPVYADIDPETFNIDPANIEVLINDKTRAIVPVSLYGQCAEFDQINEIAARHGLAVIEDAAQSFGAQYRDRKSCSLTTLACTSFFPSKPLGCYGDGGAIFTNDDAIAQKLKWIRVHGQDKRYHHAVVGINGRLDTLQAAILLAKFDNFEEEVQLRNQVAQRYSQLLPADSVVLPTVKSHNLSVFAQYTIQVKDRATFQARLSEHNIPTAVHYPCPLYKQPAIFQGGTILANTEYAANHVVSLPMHPFLEEPQQDQVIEAVNIALA